MFFSQKVFTDSDQTMGIISKVTHVKGFTLYNALNLNLNVQICTHANMYKYLHLTLRSDHTGQQCSAKTSLFLPKMAFVNQKFIMMPQH